MTRLQHLSKLVMNQGARGERPFVALENVEPGTGRLLVNGALSIRSEADAGCAAIEPGDVLFGKLRPYLAKSWLCDQPAYASTELLALRPNDNADSRWLSYLMSSRPLIEWSVATSEGTKMPRTSWEKMRLFNLISVPSVADQQTIADYLDGETARIDALIDKKMRILMLMGDRTEILLAKYVDELIERYGEVPLKSVAKLSVSNVDKKSYEGQISVQLCNYTDVYYQRKISKEIVFMDATADFAQIQKLTLNKGDVLITKDSETADDIAVPALVVEDLPGVVLGYHLALLRPFGILGDFLYWVVLSRRCRDAFSLAASGVTRFGLRQDAIARVPVAAASLEEQKSLVKLLENSVSSSDLVVDLIQRQVALLKERRQALITAAVTGEIEIPEVAA